MCRNRTLLLNRSLSLSLVHFLSIYLCRALSKSFGWCVCACISFLFLFSCRLFLILIFQCYLLQFQFSIYFQLHLINFLFFSLRWFSLRVLVLGFFWLSVWLFAFYTFRLHNITLYLYSNFYICIEMNFFALSIWFTSSPHFERKKESEKRNECLFFFVQTQRNVMHITHTNIYAPYTFTWISFDFIPFHSFFSIQSWKFDYSQKQKDGKRGVKRLDENKQHERNILGVKDPNAATRYTDTLHTSHSKVQFPFWW